MTGRTNFFTMLAIVLIALGSVFFALNEAHRNRIITSDSIVYVDTARHIAAGKEIRTSILRLRDTEVEPAQTQWPPFYPMVMSPFIRLGADPIFAGRLVSAISFGLLTLFIGLWVWRTLMPLAGIAAAALLTTLPSLTGVAAAVWADSLYTLIVIILVALGTRLLNRPTTLRWFVFGALIGVAIFTKYLGAILIAVAAMFLAFEFRRRQDLRLTLKHSLFVLAGMALYLLPMLLRNVLLDRPLGGAQRYLSNQSFETILADTLRTLAKNFTENSVWVTLLALTAISIIILLRKKPTSQSPPEKLRFPLVPITLTTFIYILGLIITRWFIDTDPIHTRFLVPVYPLIVVVFIILLAKAGFRLHQNVAPVLFTLLTVVSVGYAAKAYDFTIGPYQIQETSRIRWVRENTTDRDLLIGDQAPEYTLFLGRPSLYLEANPNAAKLHLEDLPELQQQWSRHFDRILFTLTPNVEPKKYGEYAASLSRREIQSAIPMFVHEEAKLVVYQLP